MYMCTICGLKKPELGSNPEFEFRSRRRQQESGYMEGISDWCSKCEALRFFLKSDNSNEPSQYLQEQPKRKFANSALEATANSLQRPRRNARANQNDSNMNTPLDRHIQNEVDKFFRQESLGAIPTQYPRNLDQQLRSHSADRARRRNQYVEQRSKSTVREPLHKLHQADHRRCHIRNLTALGALKSNKNVQLDERDATHSAGQRNDLKDLEDEPTVPLQYMRKAPMDKMQNPWQEEVQRQVNQLLVNSAYKGEVKVAKTCDERKLDDEVATNRLTMYEVARDIREMEQDALKKELNQKMLEKQSLVCEWNRIRRRVEGECNRVKAELDDLERQRNMELKPAVERQQGGGPIRPPPPPFKQLESDLERQLKNKNDKLDQIDKQRLESILATLQENSQQVECPFNELDENECEYGFQPSAPPVSETDIELSETHIEKRTDTLITQPMRVTSNLSLLVSTVQRATFCSFAQDPQQLLQALNKSDQTKRDDPPPAQFSTVPCHSKELINLLQIKQPNMLRPLKFCRLPILCPHVDCGRMFHISEFKNHLMLEHPSLPIERIYPGRARTFYLDTRVTLLNNTKCNMVYFVNDKFNDKNCNSKLPNLFPVLVMTARLHMPEFLAANNNYLMQSTKSSIGGPDTEIFLIWLTSVKPQDMQIIGTIAVWPTNRDPLIEYLTVQTNEVYDIHLDQRLQSIYNSNRALTLSGNYVNRITEGGKYLLPAQVLIH
ncbi:GH14920 [Drosophila grimshawi]|uniref:GH14920 n=1 Tax=Drosophila grimshawi TaxID=7222 RepID=B4J1R2_DROGR|nr:GH14920 [Drosophila grimshawi]